MGIAGKSGNRNKKSQAAGTALIITLWVTAILSMLAFSTAYFSRTDLKMAHYQAEHLKAYALARGGIEIGIAKLLIDSRESPYYDAYNEDWSIGEAYLEELGVEPEKLQLVINDESSKINLNMDNFYNLFSFLQFLPGWSGYEEITGLLDSFKDWRDEDSFEELNGAEDPYYLSLDNPYPCKDGKLDIPEEILLVKGMSPELFSYDYFTVFGGEKVNINTAPKEILYAILKGENVSGAEVLAEMIIASRRGEDGKEGTDDDQPFISLNEPLIPTEIQKLLKFSSSHFKISATARLINLPVRKKIEVILDRNHTPVKILYWHES